MQNLNPLNREIKTATEINESSHRFFESNDFYMIDAQNLHITSIHSKGFQVRSGNGTITKTLSNMDQRFIVIPNPNYK